MDFSTMTMNHIMSQVGAGFRLCLNNAADPLWETILIFTAQYIRVVLYYICETIL